MFVLKLDDHARCPQRSYDELKDAIVARLPRRCRRSCSASRASRSSKPHELALGTVAAVAEAAGVQPSALIRFANALGFGGFSEMQQVFRGRLVERSASYRERIDRAARAAASRRRHGVLHQFVAEAIAELGHLEEHVRARDIESPRRS